ncbi:MAG: dTMP kinase [Sphaerochaetaceae bacterium]|nr:dTMP kinase [Sphaerochaetaceae bacterium]
MNQILKNFYVLEGLDGAGTTTQTKLIESFLLSKQIPFFLTFEPTSSEIGQIARKILQGKIQTTPLALAFQFCADREDHLNNKENGIIKKLEEGKKVISDRYFYSSLAYQSLGATYEKVRELNNFPAPEFIFFLDTPCEVCIDRIDIRGASKELFEEIEILKKVKNNYEKAFSELDDKVNLIRIDGTLPKEKIFEIIKKYL